jgi:hypothetical protein
MSEVTGQEEVEVAHHEVVEVVVTVLFFGKIMPVERSVQDPSYITITT